MSPVINHVWANETNFRARRNGRRTKHDVRATVCIDVCMCVNGRRRNGQNAKTHHRKSHRWKTINGYAVIPRYNTAYPHDGTHRSSASVLSRIPTWTQRSRADRANSWPYFSSLSLSLSHTHAHTQLSYGLRDERLWLFTRLGHVWGPSNSFPVLLLIPRDACVFLGLGPTCFPHLRLVDFEALPTMTERRDIADCYTRTNFRMGGGELRKKDTCTVLWLTIV